MYHSYIIKYQPNVSLCIIIYLTYRIIRIQNPIEFHGTRILTLKFPASAEAPSSEAVHTASRH